MKLVTTEAVMTALCQHCDSHIEMCEECGMREIIESVPSAWISVKDRLPDEGQECLFVYMRDVWCGDYRDGQFRFQRQYALITKADAEKVTHWMPLPDAPEVEE